MAKKQEYARLVPTAPETRIEHVHLALRPLRLAFLIDADASLEEVAKYIDYNTSIWGGKFNFLVPTKGGVSMDPDWWKALQLFNPDKIIDCCQLTQQLKKQIRNEVQPFRIHRWSDKVGEHHREAVDLYDSVPMNLILFHLFQRIRPVEKSGVRLVDCEGSSLVRMCLIAQFGRLESNLADFVQDAFKAEKVALSGEGIHDYLRLTTALSESVTPVSLTAHGLSVGSNEVFGDLLGTTVVLLEASNLVEGICFFWNLRQLHHASLGSISEPVLIPQSFLSTPEDINVLSEWAEEKLDSTNVLTLVKPGSNTDELVRLSDELKQRLPAEVKVEGWYDHFHSIEYRTVHLTASEEARLSGRQLDLTLPQPEWAEYARGNAKWVVDIDLQGRPSIGPGKGFIPPKFTGLTDLLNVRPGEKWIFSEYPLRFSQKYISALVGRSERHKRVNLPGDQELLLKFLESKGYQPKVTDKNRYIVGMIRLLGGYQEAEIFSDAGVRRLLETMKSAATKHGYGYGFTLDRIRQAVRQGGEFSKYESEDDLINFVSDLALKGIFLRGYNIRCPKCDLTQWYSLNAVAEQFKCVGCLTWLQPPIRADFSYRLNELFVRGIQQGAIPVLLTNLLLAQLSNESYLFTLGVEVTKEEFRIDLDILASCNGTVSIAEAKTLDTISEKAVEEIYVQLSQICRAAMELNAGSVVLGTLMKELPPELQKAVSELQKQTPNIKLHVATVEELERGYFIKSESGRERRFNIYDLQHFESPDHKAGRILEQGKKYVRKHGISHTSASTT